MPNGTYGGVRGEKFIKNYPLLDYILIFFTEYSKINNNQKKNLK